MIETHESKQTPAQLAIQALKRMRGDDLERARAMFCRLTPEEMTQQRDALSGETPQKILDRYEQLAREIDEAIEWARRFDEMTMDKAATEWTAAWRVIVTALKEMGVTDVDHNAAAIIARLSHAGMLIVTDVCTIPATTPLSTIAQTPP